LSQSQASEDALLAGEASLQLVNELGVQAPAGSRRRGPELLPKMHRHPEQEAIDLPCHLSRATLTYLHLDIKYQVANISANITTEYPQRYSSLASRRAKKGRPEAALLSRRASLV
jgi:hypothetical protein